MLLHWFLTAAYIGNRSSQFFFINCLPKWDCADFIDAILWDRDPSGLHRVFRIFDFSPFIPWVILRSCSPSSVNLPTSSFSRRGTWSTDSCQMVRLIDDEADRWWEDSNLKTSPWSALVLNFGLPPNAKRATCLLVSTVYYSPKRHRQNHLSALEIY